ncbi:phage major capsid protein [Pseudochrobactrum saccharolyticum]|uniref:phage major capsid protein n=1 Tax=Pseudochrobactrum saccharolyticum TaxID=354352 RepID=UPI0027661988|nr:phage major capsid protein [Pseudochrobactrum saccharolyticum]MDP8251474.1 phage major capsid protein [Pseudochrobactrum saccharolyticum]
MKQRLEFKAAFTIDDLGTITGIAWPFGSPDRVGDMIEKGAITSPSTLPMLFAHDQSQVIGVWDQITETNDDLTVKGRLLIDDVERAREVRAMIREKAVTGLSIGFVPKATKPRKRGRTITALDLHEISVVAVPCHPDAQITSIKAADDTADHKGNPMENEETEVKAEPVITAEELAEIKSLKSDVATLKAKLNRPFATNANHPDATNDNSFERKSFVEFARRGVEHLEQKAAATLVVSNDTQGGYLAPEAFSSEILKTITEFSPIRNYARIMQISAAEIKIPRLVSGTSGVWLDETEEAPQSDMTYEQITLTPYRVGTFVDVSTQLLQDNAYNLESELASDLAEKFGKLEATAFVSGNGDGKPKGLLAATGITEMKTGNAGTLGTDPAATLIAMFHSVPSIVAHNGVWMMNRKTLGALRSLKNAAGDFIMLDPITAGAPTTLLGRPIVEMVDMPDVAANAVPIMFGNLSGYRIVDRIGFSLQRNPYTLDTKGQVRFTAHRRVGGAVTNPDHFIKLKVAA